MPPFVPRHDITVAPGTSPPSRIPPHETPASRCQERIHALDEPALELVLVLETKLANAILNLRARLPERLVRFVTPDVDELAWEQLHHFGEHVLHEGHSRLVGVQNVR